MLGGVDDPFPDPLPVFTVDVDLLVISAPLPESLELLEARSDLKLLLDSRLRSWRKDGIPVQKGFELSYMPTKLIDRDCSANDARGLGETGMRPPLVDPAEGWWVCPITAQALVNTT